MKAENVTLADYLNWFGDHAGGRILRWQIAKTHEERLTVLEEVLSQCYSNLVDTRGLNQNRSEDELSMQVANMLVMAGISARHDRHVNGHCDIVVDADGGFMWLGEAKVHKDYGWLVDGFLQLSTRYGTAMAGRDHGEMIIYHRDGDSINVLRSWRERLRSDFPDVDLIEDVAQPNLYFRTRHACPISGCSFYVRHTIVPLMHAPKK